MNKLDKIDDLYNEIKLLKKNKIYSLNEEIKIKKREREALIIEAHNEYIKTHKKRMIFLDILVILFILNNLGALCLTNMLVMKVETNKTFYEVNPVTAATHGFVTQQTKEFFAKYFGLIMHLFVWCYMIIMYIIGRNRTVVNNFTYYVMLASVLGLGYILVYDFVNDLGYWVGKLIWGVTT